jgi:hypothetical protein
MGYLVGEYEGELGAVRDAGQKGIGEYHLSMPPSKGVWGSRLDDGKLFRRMESPNTEVSSNR